MSDQSDMCGWPKCTKQGDAVRYLGVNLCGTHWLIVSALDNEDDKKRVFNKLNIPYTPPAVKANINAGLPNKETDDDGKALFNDLDIQL